MKTLKTASNHSGNEDSSYLAKLTDKHLEFTIITQITVNLFNLYGSKSLKFFQNVPWTAINHMKFRTRRHFDPRK